MRKIHSALHEKLEKLVNSMGYELYGAELTEQDRRVVFRVLIDSEQGVKADDCSLISRQVSAMMDVEDPIQGHYVLEVSSPGIDRPLFEMKHYQKHIGSRLKVRLHMSVEGRRQYKGVLVRTEADLICLLVDESSLEVTLPFSSIEKANVIGDVHL
jgi:ribosome maturation factor RimP